MSDQAPRSIDEETARAARLFLASLGNFPVRKAFLFGSRARGDYRPESDADIAVLLDGPHGRFLDTTLELADIAYDVLLETGIHIQPLPLWQEEWDQPQTFSNPSLVEAIRREGIPL